MSNTDYASTDFCRPVSLATRTLNTHVSDAHGLCAVCTSHWPCKHAVLAEHNPETLSDAEDHCSGSVP
jgi:hypothetical protein